MGSAEIRAYLSWLATRQRVAASTQNQALNALLFLYKDVLREPVPALADVVRARGPVRLPTVLSRAEVRSVLGQLAPRQRPSPSARDTPQLIAFASLSAHRKQYSEAYANYQLHWRAKDMLKAVGALNPDFFPIPLLPPVKTGDKSWHFPGYVQNALSQAEFEQLYDVCGEILHMRNPFSTKDPITNIGYSVDDWVARIERLLAWHSVQLLDGQRWLCQIPAEGPVHVTTGSPLPEKNAGQPQGG